jgi:hypothetical protein
MSFDLRWKAKGREGCTEGQASQVGRYQPALPVPPAYFPRVPGDSPQIAASSYPSLTVE